MQEIFRGKNALIIGGTGGIGLPVAEKLKDLGAVVTVAGRTRPPEDSGLLWCGVDFLRDGGVAARIEGEFSKAIALSDILVVTYGPFLQKPLHETTAEDWLYLAAHDYALPGIAVSTALPGMMARGFGRILLFGGTRTMDINAYRTNAAYAGAKTGISVIIKSVSAEYGRYGIICNGICPGFTRNAPEKKYEITPETVADHAVTLLSSPELNGVLLNVDGGWQPSKS